MILKSLMQCSIVMVLRTKEREKNTMDERLMRINERVVLKEDEISLYKKKRMKPNKASGPDGIRPSGAESWCRETAQRSLYSF